jgi:hypothetical protein
MVLEVLSEAWLVILVVDMDIFLEHSAMHSETPVKVSWSDLGPQYTYCFQHHQDHSISVFGCKMVCALPPDRIPEHGRK